MIVPHDDYSETRPRVEIIDADGGDRRPLELPLGKLLLGGWGTAPAHPAVLGD
jgi:hypothetical protein